MKDFKFHFCIQAQSKNYQRKERTKGGMITAVKITARAPTIIIIIIIPSTTHP